MPKQTSASQQRTSRFQPELIETSSRSSKEGPSNSQTAQARLASQRHSDRQRTFTERREHPIKLYDDAERNRSLQQIWCTENTQAVALHEPSIQTAQDSTKVGFRRFPPQLMETDTRSFRRTDTLSQEGRKQKPQQEALNLLTAVGDVTYIHRHLAHESRFSYMALRQRQETRRHSFRIPNLPAIPSSFPESPHRVEKHNKAGLNKSISLGDKSPELLFTIAAITAEKQLKEQALAAFPNEQDHQPVDHFAIDREDEEIYSNEVTIPAHFDVSTSRAHRRTSSADLSWELEYMRRHKEEAEMSDRAMARTRGSPFSPMNDVHSLGTKPQVTHQDNRVKGRDLATVKSDTTPRMLGEDLIFPQSLSPESTICEGSNIQHNVTRNRLCGCSGLWYGPAGAHDRPSNGGLWKGTCQPQNPQQTQSPQQSVVCPVPQRYKTSTLQPSDADHARTNRPTQRGPGEITPTISMANQDFRHEPLESELHDGLVTQIYNYLSLGYPCVARYFDHELSRISGISVADLRQDDLKSDAMGHVGVSDSLSKGADTSTGICMRWRALQLYILDWARERHRTGYLDMNGEHGAWGVCERKGSWAV
ncbi:uncharacterized protein BP01DRAFT_416432 [Aspergillus saccharolyticus JOP 1030-1]|uniref:Uncharacterized protein n=1 Tax=Aspergillus saccharolyticus JOP 1030-1 TaxID=1450539 RepID=A0A319AD61_9EURO|nr:hypothetical protein BP01DRAFT_416432 [Aspergillus saccharolyticus JOP 1030-1]PYH44802.1 hypothetical protein BP01DRAFT_416432 [Aspergillus saccharolyticus JOP 1030-1]